MSDPRSPWFTPPPAPPPPPKGPPAAAGFKLLLVTLGAVVGVGLAAMLVVPAVLDLRHKSNDHDEEPARPTKPPKPKPSYEKTTHKLPPALPVLETDPVRGDPRALVTVVEFGDLQDPFTARLETTLEDVLKKYGSDVRIVWKDYPLAFHYEARPAARAARVAMLEGGPSDFWKLHDKILANQKDLKSELSTWSVDFGADPSAVSRHGKRADALIDATVELAKDLGVPGTPCTYIDGEKLSGARPLAEYEKIIDAHLAEAKKLLAAGTAREDLYAELVERHFDDIDPTAGGTLYNVDVAGAPAVGKSDALVTAVVFVDPERAPYGVARMKLDELGALDDTRVVLRDVPSTPKGREAAAVLRAIGDKSGLAERAKATEAMWASFPTNLVTFAAGYGVSAADAMAAIAGAKALKTIDDDLELADAVDAAATPQTTLFLNGRKQWSWAESDVKATHGREKKRAHRLVLKGTPRSDVYEALVKKGKVKARKHVTVVVPPHAPTRGPASAKVTIHVFSDFQCPFCAKALGPTGSFTAAVAAHASDVRVVYRHNPLAFHAMAEPASELAIEAKVQKGVASFWRVHDKLYGAAPLDMKKLEAIAVAEGLDLTKVRVAIATKAHKKEIDDDVAEARRVGAFGTPAFVVGDELVSGAQPQTAFEAAITRVKSKSP
ncbi:MAG: thioredoxin domain-containing protein [Deltaproteobacteria bacterium]|nr:thioredoxin domain-containing protein [Deltaproteobacteria bacterium]